MRLDEYEAIRLADYEGLRQEDVARHLGVSRPTVSRILASGRRKLAMSITEGMALFIEGGPVKLLEALGCGRPVVIGKGVGIESELPHVSGIQRYKCGDLDSLIAAIKAALNSPMTPEQLQGLVAERTPRAWAAGWAAAVLEVGA